MSEKLSYIKYSQPEFIKVKNNPVLKKEDIKSGNIIPIEEDTEEVDPKMSMFIRGSLKWRAAYFFMRFLMVIEGFLWSFMDMTRSLRMKVSARINRNYNDRS